LTRYRTCAPAAHSHEPATLDINKATKYARYERERRFLLSGPPPGPVIKRIKISDRHILGTRLRLRWSVLVDGDGADVVYKLTQKLPSLEACPGLTTTMYLTEAEYSALAKLPARQLQKTRSSVPPLGVDFFDGDLRGLIVAEAEFDTDEAMEGFLVPPFAVAEITQDLRFTGGYLVGASRLEVQAALNEFGIQIE